jgi:hypothetical protein
MSKNAKNSKKGKKSRKKGRKKTSTLAALTRRVEALESTVRSPNALPQKAGKHPAPPPATRALVFSLAPGSAPRVRVTLDDTEVVLFAGWSTPSKPRAKGDWVSVLVEVMGNIGDKAIVDITNSEPAQLTTPPIQAGSTNIADPRVIEASWN